MTEIVPSVKNPRLEDMDDIFDFLMRKKTKFGIVFIFPIERDQKKCRLEMEDAVADFLFF